METYICAVCGVKTYRKRIRALSLQQFPFLHRESQPGSLCITLNYKYYVVSCFDCSETLLAQSAEYDRLGLPVEKGQFNWIARSPPPENSEEASVARLPSGKIEVRGSSSVEIPFTVQLSSKTRAHCSYPELSPKPWMYQMAFPLSAVPNVSVGTSHSVKTTCFGTRVQVEQHWGPKQVPFTSECTKVTFSTCSYTVSSYTAGTPAHQLPSFSNVASENFGERCMDMYIHKKRNWQVFVQQEKQTLIPSSKA